MEDLQLTPRERADILRRREEDRKHGAYWLTPEGRDELRGIFDDPDGTCSVRPLLDALEDTERRLEAALDVLRGYERWEADIIMSDAAWDPNGMAEFPRLVDELYDGMMDLQARRNDVLQEKN